MFFRQEVWEKDDELLAGVLRAYQAAYDAIVTKRNTEWPRAFLLYHCKQDPTMFTENPPRTGRAWPYKANICKPWAPIQVEAAVPRLREALVEGIPQCKPYVEDVRLDNKGILWHHAVAVQHLLRNQLYHDIGFRALAGPLVRSQQIYGTAIVRIEWLRRRGSRYAVREGRFQEVQEAAIDEGLRATLVPNPNFFPDPRGRSIRGRNDTQPCRYVAEIYVEPVDDLIGRIISTLALNWHPELKKAAKQNNPYKALRDWLDPVMGSVTADDDWVKRQNRDIGRSDDTGDAVMPEDRELVRLISLWEAGLPARRTLIAGKKGGGKVLLRQEQGGHPAARAGIPYVAFISQPSPHDFWGTSKITQIATTIHEANVMTALRLASVKRAIEGITIINSTANIQRSDILGQERPLLVTDGYVPLKECVQHVELGDPGATAYREVDELRGEANVAAGGTDPMLGTSPANTGNTARGQLAQIEQGSARWALEGQQLGECTAEMMQVMLDFDRQYITKGKYVEIAGEEGAAAWAEVTPAMIGHRWRLTFDTEPVVTNKSLAFQRVVNWGQLVLPLRGTNLGRFVVDTARMLGLHNPDEYWMEQFDDAQAENVKFLETGRFPYAHPADNHEYHKDVHMQMEPIARARGPQWIAELERHAILEHTMKQFAQPAPQGGMAQGGMPQGGQPPGMGQGYPPAQGPQAMGGYGPQPMQGGPGFGG